jgi:hypothetical protein
VSSVTSTGIKRTGPPQAVQKIRDNVYLVQIPISESPGGNWRRLFYELQGDAPPEFPPRSVEITGTLLRFRSDAESVGAKTKWIDRWMEKASVKEASMGGRTEETRRQRDEHVQENQELAEMNARWANI